MPCADGLEACVGVELAIAFADGELAPAARAEVERHIDVCPGCRAIVAEAARDDAGPPPPASAGAAAVDRGLLAPGQRVGRYVIERAIGTGGMGVVALARDPELRRAVVIKLVRPDALADEGDDALEARLRREAQAMAQVSHPNVVQIFDIGRHGDRVFLAMEFIAGPTLDAWLIERARTRDQILAMFRQAGAGLAAAHRAGLLHRDFKPANVLVDRDGVAKVTDFGLARALPASAAAPRVTRPLSTSRPSGVHAVLTHVDAIVGTPAYMAPEQADGRVLDDRTDQYAFALALLDALVDQPPTRRAVDPTRSPAEVEAALLRAGVAAPSARAIARALDANPVARFPTLGALLAELVPPVRKRRWVPVAAGAAAVATAATIWLASPTRRQAVACAAQAPARWAGPARAGVVAALTARPQPFASWRAEQVAAAVDAEVGRIGELERAVCDGTTPAPAAACLVHRRDALERAIAALAARPPSDDPWPWVRALGACADAAPAAGGSGAAAALRRELAAERSAPRARALAERARELDVPELEADALIVAGAAALAMGDVTTSERDLQTAGAIGDRAGDDAARADALRHLLALARWRGDHAAAVRDGDALRALVMRHGDRPADVLAAAAVEIPAYVDLGDVARADAAIERAVHAATAAGAPDELLRARAGRAWARHAIHFDTAGADHERDEALTAASVSPRARADALAVRARLALAAGDGERAGSALSEAARLDPDRALAVADRLPAARARALSGDLDGALAELDALAPGDVLDQARVAIARGQILHHGGRLADALTAMSDGLELFRGASSPTGLRLQRVSRLERLEAAMARCDVEIAAAVPEAQVRYCWEVPDLATPLADEAPVRARVRLQQARGHRVHQRSLATFAEEKALAIMRAAGAPALVRAPVAWSIAQSELGGLHAHRRTLALEARRAFADAGRTAEVAAIDAWLAATGGL